MLRKVSSVLSVAKAEYFRIFLNPRIIVAGMLLVFIENLVISPLIGRSEKLGVPLNIAEPFVAVGNSGALLLFIPATFLILLSDFPGMGKQVSMVVPRTGRMIWMAGLLLAALFSSVSFVGMVFLFCCILTARSGVIATAWSDVVTKYGAAFPDERSSYISEYLPPNLYNQIPFTEALLHTFLLLILYLFLLCLVLAFFKIQGMKTAGITVVFVVIACGVITCSLKTDAMWLFPMANTISWLHYSEAFREPIKNMSDSYLYFLCLILFGAAADLFIVRKVNMNAMEE